MYELIQVSDKDYYIDCPSKIGIVMTGECDVCLIDSGNSKDTAKKVSKVLQAKRWTPKAIYNTHSHGDHIGGNRYLEENFSCKVYASGIETDFTRHPILEPAYLYGGYPPKDLRSKFLVADASGALPLTENALPDGFAVKDLPGHFFDMVGYLTPSGTFYIADALASRETLDKYGITVLYDVAAHLETLEWLMRAEAKIFVPSHAAPTDDIAPLAQYNIDKTHEVAENIFDILKEETCFEHLLQKLFTRYGLTMSFEQYVLVGSTVRSYLAWLKNRGEVSVDFSTNIPLWKRI